MAGPTQGQDWINGTEYADYIDALGGNDWVYGKGGNDVISGGWGVDWLYGDGGRDTIFGGYDRDYINGGADSDRLFGESGDDQLSGGDGDDAMDGGDGGDFMFGDWGWDTMWGGEGADNMYGGYGYDKIDGGWGNDFIMGEGDSDTLDGGGGDDYVSGGAGYDTLLGGSGKDTLVGDAANDVLYGESGDDYLNGGSGNDTLIDTSGNDTYVFGLGSNSDIIQESGGTSGDKILMTSGVTSSSVILERSGYDLNVKLSDGSRLRVVNQFLSSTYFVETIEFADGSRLDLSAPLPIMGTPNPDVLNGTASADLIYGLGSDDVINAGAGNDTIDGGAGNDTLTGGSGDDLYTFAAGQGQDLIVESAGTDTLRLGAGIASADVRLIADGDDLLVTVNGSTDRVTVAGFLASDGAKIERIEFADGSAWDAAEIAARIEQANSAPEASDFAVTAVENGEQGFAFAATDPDEGDVLSYEVLTQPDLGSVSVTEAGFTFQPGTAFDALAEGETATISFTWRASDQHGALSEIRTATVTVTGTNDAPVVATQLSSTTHEDAAPFTADLLAGVTDVDASDVLSATDLVQVSGRPAAFSLSGAALSLDPAQFNDLAVGESATLVFGYNVFDGTVKVARTLTLTVDGRNDAPVVEAALSAATHEDAAPLSVDLLAGASDVDTSDVLSATNLVQVAGRAASFTLAGGSLVLDPGQFNDLAVGESATLVFSYDVFDGTASVAQTLTLTIEGRNDGPVAVADYGGAVASGGALRIEAIDLLANDGDADATDTLSIVSVGNAVNGWAVLTADGGILVQPHLGYAGPVTFEYTVSDGHGGFSTATVTVDSTLPPGGITGGTAGTDRLEGDAGDNVIDGGTGDDRLRGRDGNDTLIGGEGNDELRGEDGDDLFLVAGDSGVDSFIGGRGYDLVKGSIGDDVIGLGKFASSDSVEEIDGGLGVNRIVGTDGKDKWDFSQTVVRNIAAIDGGAGDDEITGSQGADVLVGGAGNDDLSGGAGNDVLAGGSGNDRLWGGSGLNTYAFGREDGADTVYSQDTEGDDRVTFGAGIAADQLWFSRQHANLVVGVIGTADSLTIDGWYSGTRVSEFRLADDSVLDDAQVQNLVSAMAAMSPPPLGQTTLSEQQHQQLDAVLAANWQHA